MGPFAANSSARSIRLRGLATLAGLVAISLIPNSRWPWLAGVCVALLVWLKWIRINGRELAGRILIALPLLAGLSISLMFGSRVDHRIDGGLAIFLRGLAAVLLVSGFVHRVGLLELVGEIERWPVPRLLPRMLWLMARYQTIFQQELARMQLARRARSFQPSRWWDTIAAGRLLGALLLRGLNRADRVHSAMLARGWNPGMRVDQHRLGTAVDMDHS